MHPDKQFVHKTTRNCALQSCNRTKNSLSTGDTPPATEGFSSTERELDRTSRADWLGYHRLSSAKLGLLTITVDKLSGNNLAPGSLETPWTWNLHRCIFKPILITSAINIYSNSIGHIVNMRYLSFMMIEVPDCFKN